MTMRPLAPRRGPAIYDGLWQCLCPAFDRLTFQKALNRSIPSPSPRAQRRAFHARPNSCTTTSPAALSRHFSTNSSIAESSEAPVAINYEDGPHSERFSIGPLLKPKLPPADELQSYPIQSIESAILKIRSPQTEIPFNKEIQVPGNINRSHRIIELITHLLSQRSYQLCSFVYESLADAYASPKGSATALNKLMFHMDKHDVKPTAEFCKLAMAVLANHPNYTLRAEVMGVMKEYWFDMEGEARQYYLLGLLRDEQYELAYEKLKDATESWVRTGGMEPWVLNVFMFVFGRMGFLDEMCTIYEWREQLIQGPGGGKKMEPRSQENTRQADKSGANPLYYMLDVCSAAYHYRGTMFAWDKLVPTGLLSPSDGILENVAGTAARHGDTTLASEVLEMLSSRSRVQPWHYEAVVEAFLQADDFVGAFRLFDIMSRQGFQVTAAETHVVYETLTARPHLCEEAEAALQESFEQSATGNESGYPLMAAVAKAMAEQWGSLKAMGLYLDVKTLCGRQLQSDLVLAMMLHSRNDRDTFSECLQDYEGLSAKKGIVEERLSREERSQLILQFSEAGRLEPAFQLAIHAARTKATTKDGRRGWLEPLLEASIKKEDSRVWELLDAFAEAGDEEGARVIRGILHDAREQGGLPAGRRGEPDR